MKTTINSRTTRLSQSEAMLEAIQNGFFEAYLDKSEMSHCLETNQVRRIRLAFSKLSTGERLLLAKTINWSGIESILAQKQITGNPDFNTSFTGSSNFSVEFSLNDLQELLSQPECTGLRFYPGWKQQRPTLIAVAVRKNGFDIADGVGYLKCA